MKLAVVSTILEHPWGGADALWTRASEAALERGDSLLLLLAPPTAHHPRVEAMVRRGASLKLRRRRYVQSFPVKLARKWDELTGRREDLVRDLAEFMPDLVVINGGGTADVILEPELMRWLMSRSIPFRIICNWQEERPKMTDRDKATLARAFAVAESVFFVSSRNLAVTEQLLGIPLERAQVIHNPLRLPPGELPLVWPKEGVFRMAVVGRLSREKGCPLILPAIKEALGDASDWTLDFYGDGPERPLLDRAIRDLGLEGRVALRGFVSDLESIWSNHVLLLSAAVDEGVPMTIPEAMLRGRPVLATRVGGAEDWISAGKDGFLCAAATHADLVASLSEAWAERDRWKELGEAAARSAGMRYRPDDFLRIIERAGASRETH